MPRKRQAKRVVQDAVRALRGFTGSRGELAKLAGLHPVTLWKYENRRLTPSVDAAVRLEAAISAMGGSTHAEKEIEAPAAPECTIHRAPGETLFNLDEYRREKNHA